MYLSLARTASLERGDGAAATTFAASAAPRGGGCQASAIARSTFQGKWSDMSVALTTSESKWSRSVNAGGVAVLYPVAMHNTTRNAQYLRRPQVLSRFIFQQLTTAADVPKLPHSSSNKLSHTG